jgi:iron complex outermembrane receptor protein
MKQKPGLKLCWCAGLQKLTGLRRIHFVATFLFPVFLFIITSLPCSAQEPSPDSLKILDEVVVRSFEQNRSLSSTVTNVRVITPGIADRGNKTSLVAGFNSIAGVRMEERSPGSYRINIRGSSLRSPFGIRNVKVYWNDIPVTDPGGNTYFNQFAWNNFSHIEVFKGPAGSLYGAGTGGLIIMNSLSSFQPGPSLEYVSGSYGTQSILAAFRYGKDENRSQLTYSHNGSNGYREQSQFRRDNFAWVTNLKVSDRQFFSASLLFTDLYYQTPGALTLEEFKANPKGARPASGPFPSATAAKAAIKQMNFLAGFSHTYKMTRDVVNQTTFYGSFAEVKNPAIRNYERRTEPSFGGRTTFSYEKKEPGIDWQFVAGSEFQHGFYNTLVLQNAGGSPDSLEANDDVVFTATSIFVQGDIGLGGHTFINAGFSMNKTKVGFTRLSDYPIVTQSRNYRNEIAPRISAKKLFPGNTYMKATVSRGFSPPTVAELLPSSGVISTSLEAEYGWNYELTAGKLFVGKKLKLEATGFYFRINNALVQRRDSSGGDFFVNAGDVKQKGIEFTADYAGYSRGGFFDNYSINAAYAFNAFRYGRFVRGVNDDLSGNKIPSVPVHTFSLLADVQFRKGLYTNITWYSASEIFLNDANTATAEPYHLLGWRLGWKKTVGKKLRLNLYAGAENLFDEMYSLGNDINAAGGRYYNSAPGRNYYAGIAVQWLKTGTPSP